MSIKIYHSADVQVNCAGKHSNRYNEHVYMLEQQSNTVINEGYDIAVFVGDMFERAITTDTEKALLVKHLIKPILDAGIPVFWTDGNHDLKQSKFTFDPGDGSNKEEVGVLRALTDLIDSPLLTYGEETGFYNMGEFHDKNLIIACWAHKSKYSAESKPISPWYVLSQKPVDEQEPIRKVLEQSIVFDTFHDPVRDVKNFDGKVVRGENEVRTDISEFLGDFCLMGDIHMPSIMRSENRAAHFFATYPSSPMVLYFGEGDYYENTKLVSERNQKHGFNHIVAHSKTSIDVNFVPYNQHTTRHTITITDGFELEDVDNFELVNASSINNFVRLIITTFKSMDVVDALIKHLNSKYTVSIEDIQTKTNSTLSQNTLGEAFDVTDLSDKDYIIKVATQCITDKVNASRDTEEYKNILIADAVKLFTEALENTQYVTTLSKYKFGYLNLVNFMPIRNLSINFDDLREKGTISKINGNNGNGKSTIFKGLLWVGKGKIDARQSDNKAKQNNLDYFNDKVWDKDVTLGGFGITAGEDKIDVTRSIKRIWGAKTTDADKKSVNWKSFVTKVEESLEVKVNGETLPDSEAEAKLLDIFGDFAKFQGLHVVNQAHLDSLLNLPLDKLIDYILKSVGFTLSEQLKANVDSEKEKLFKGLVKHGKDIAGINIDIGIKNTEIEQTEEQIGFVEKNIETATNQISEVNVLINYHNSKLHVISDEQRNAVSKKTQITEQISGVQLQIKETQNKIDNPVWSQEKKDNLERLKQDQINLNSSLITATGNISNLQTKSATLSSDINVYNVEVTSIENHHKTEIKEKISGIQLDRLNNLQRISELNKTVLDSVNSEGTRINEEIELNISSLNKTIESNSLSKSQYEQAVSKLEGTIESEQNQIDKLNSGSCQICDKSYTELPTVKAEVAKHQSTIDTARANITNISSHIEKFGKTIEEAKAEKQNLESKRVKIISSYNEISQETLTAYTDTVSEISKLISETSEDAIKAKTETVEKLEMSDVRKSRLTELAGLIKIAVDDKEITDKSITELSAAVNGVPKKLEELALQISSEETFRDSNTSEALYKLLIKQKEGVESGEKALEQIVVTEKQLLENQVIDGKIEVEKSKLTEYKTALNTANGEAAKLRIKLTTLKTQLQNLENIIEEIKVYEHTNNVWNVFNHTIGIKGLNKYVFDTVALQINSELNTLLDSLNYRIFFDISDGYQLKMVDLLGQASIRNLYTIGGMESTLGSLALLTVIKSKTIKNNGDFLFIDEITGKLNNSKDTKGTDSTNKDYHFEFFNILKKLSNNVNICIIDHALPIEWFQSVIEIVKYDNGVSDTVVS